MAFTFDGSSQGLRLSFGSVSYPLTIALWFRDTSGSNNDRNLVQISNTSQSGRYFRLSRDATTSAVVGAANWGTFGDAMTSTTYTTNNWHHALVVYESATSRTVYLDNSGVGVDTTNTGDSSGIDELAMGFENDSSPGDTWVGDLAELGVWSGGVILTDADRAMLVAGISPKLVKPQNIIAHAPCVREMQSIMGENSGVMTDTAGNITVSEHPPMIYPSMQANYFTGGGAVPPSITPTNYYKLFLAGMT